MLSLLPRLPQYMAFRRFNRPRLLPMSLVVSVTYRCNSRCLTCNVWRRKAEELSLKEWEHIFSRLGTGIYYLTLSGGEPFLRQDIAQIVAAAQEYLRPSVITIPTNGLLPGVIPQRVEEILRACPKTEVGVNLSLDDIGTKHDAIRQVEGNYERALETFRALRSLHYPNLILGVHTVVSRFNAPRLPEIYHELLKLGADSYISEIAEQRAELGTVGLDIAPSPDEYSKAADYLIVQAKGFRSAGLSKVTQTFRARYYDLTRRIIVQKRQVIPCYAGFASGHIAPDGDVWTCCTRAQPTGNLRETDYCLAPAWFSPRGDELRHSITAGECACPLANAAYTNMLLHPPTLLRMALSLVR